MISTPSARMLSTCRPPTILWVGRIVRPSCSELTRNIMIDSHGASGPAAGNRRRIASRTVSMVW